VTGGVERWLRLGPVLLVAVAILATGRHVRADAAVVDVRTIFLHDCATCHGADGRGTDDGPSLAGQGKAAVDYVLTTGRMPITHGEAVERREPAYDPATISQLVDYIGTLIGGPDIPTVDVATADVARGGEVFREQCAACHQWSGEGGALIHREAPPLTQSTPTQVAEAMRLGPGTMPVFGPAAVSDKDVANVAAYIQYLHHPNDAGGLPLRHLGPLAEGAVGIVIGLGVLLLAARRVGSKS
jgi:ubiquinol-cytochrome c reductase cytochrome c subunit